MTRRRLLALAGAMPLLAFDDEADWRDFVAWYKKQPNSAGNVWQMYRAKLKSDGLSQAEINRIIDAVSRRAQQGNELSSLTFNRIYQSDQPSFQTAPNAFLVECAAGAKPGKALDIDMGQGRNSIFLAEKGWDVTGVDIAEEGLAKARAAAKEKGVKLNAIRQSHDKFDYGKARWDLIAMIYTWVPVSDSALIARIKESLRPGGLLVFEHFLGADGERPANNPGAVAPNQVLRVFGDLRILRYEDRIAPSDWAPGQSRIARSLATRQSV